jgi:hypothetical protein
MGPKAATTQAKVRCDFCGQFFTRLNGHYAKYQPCRDKANAREDARHSERLASRYAGGSNDPTAAHPGDSSFMDVDYADEEGSAPFQPPDDGHGPSKRPRMFSPERGGDPSHAPPFSQPSHPSPPPQP